MGYVEETTLAVDDDGFDNTTTTSIEELHKHEERKLRAEIQKLKKSVPKGDRKKKKQVDALILQVFSHLSNLAMCLYSSNLVLVFTPTMYRIDVCLFLVMMLYDCSVYKFNI